MFLSSAPSLPGMARWLAVLSILVLAGCAQPGATEPEADPEIIIDANRPQTRFGAVATGPAVGPDLNATTAQAPRLVVGEWWRVRFNDYLGEGDIEVVRVVADVNDDGYIFGMPHEGWLKEAIAFHSPAFGDVNPDLSYDTHNVRFEAVQFPLTAGATWETAFAAQPYVATVTAADEYTATIEFEPKVAPQPTDPVFALLGLAGGGPMTLTYDARQHEVVRMESAIGMWEVVEHGYDYRGWVTVPRGEHTAIDYGTFGPASQTHDVRPRTVTVHEGFNRMTMMHFVGTAGDAPAYIMARDVTPDGTEFITEMQGSGYQLRFYETNAPSGTWTVEDLVVGAGFTYHMGIAYVQYDISLPDGARRADHGHAVIR
jgi:hypothetical protein